MRACPIPDPTVGLKVLPLPKPPFLGHGDMTIFRSIEFLKEPRRVGPGCGRTGSASASVGRARNTPSVRVWDELRRERRQLALDRGACRAWQRATHEGHYYQHVQAITVAIAEKGAAAATTFSTSLAASVSVAAMKQPGIRNLTGPVCHRNLMRSHFTEYVYHSTDIAIARPVAGLFAASPFCRRRAPCA